MVGFVTPHHHANAALDFAHGDVVSLLLCLPFAYMLISGCIEHWRQRKWRS